MKRYVLFGLVLSFVLLSTPFAASADAVPASPDTTEAQAGETTPACDGVAGDGGARVEVDLEALGLEDGRVPVHGSCGSVQNECRSCSGGIQSCDYQMCYSTQGGWHKHTVYCTPCGNFC